MAIVDVLIDARLPGSGSVGKLALFPLPREKGMPVIATFRCNWRSPESSSVWWGGIGN